jgi:hypothetical protein
LIVTDGSSYLVIRRSRSEGQPPHPVPPPNLPRRNGKISTRWTIWTNRTTGAPQWVRNRPTSRQAQETHLALAPLRASGLQVRQMGIIHWMVCQTFRIQDPEILLLGVPALGLILLWVRFNNKGFVFGNGWYDNMRYIIGKVSFNVNHHPIISSLFPGFLPQHCFHRHPYPRHRRCYEPTTDSSIILPSNLARTTCNLPCRCSRPACRDCTNSSAWFPPWLLPFPPCLSHRNRSHTRWGAYQGFAPHLRRQALGREMLRWNKGSLDRIHEAT